MLTTGNVYDKKMSASKKHLLPENAHDENCVVVAT